MTAPPVYITAAGAVSALGIGTARHLAALRQGAGGIRPLTIFTPASAPPLPVGQMAGPLPEVGDIPRTHALARMALEDALSGGALPPPDAVVVGTTTGGMPATETQVRDGCTDPERYRFHGAGTVAEDLARQCGCRGPVITVSTACSSGAVAIAIGAAMVRAGVAQRVLAGGADAVCRMTYYGFNSLQLIDPAGARPMDASRRGMSVAEGAALVMLTATPADAGGVALLGAGLSCDAYHPSTPHPAGDGAVAAMAAALAEAGLSPGDIDYINLHGTGTIDNDQAEAVAVGRVFGTAMPPASAIKGATGHPLAAAGALEAVVARLCIETGLVPANTGFETMDPKMGWQPPKRPRRAAVATVMSNAFGFGGNNAVLILGNGPKPSPATEPPVRRLADLPALNAVGAGCITGAGGLAETLHRMQSGREAAGILESEALARGLPPGLVRRLKRLPRMALALADAAVSGAGGNAAVKDVFFATGWGGQSETYDFLTRLFDTRERFPSPTDFINSVHNAPAGHVAQRLGATGANVTTSGGKRAFEQALLSASLVSGAHDAPLLLMGADEYHAAFTPRLDPGAAADGGGALVLKRGGDGPAVRLLYFERPTAGPASALERVLEETNAPRRYRTIMVNIFDAADTDSAASLKRLLEATAFGGAVVDIRRTFGGFATATAAAAAAAVGLVTRVPGDGGVLILGMDETVTALEVMPA